VILLPHEAVAVQVGPDGCFRIGYGSSVVFEIFDFVLEVLKLLVEFGITLQTGRAERDGREGGGAIILATCELLKITHVSWLVGDVTLMRAISAASIWKTVQLAISYRTVWFNGMSPSSHVSP